MFRSRSSPLLFECIGARGGRGALLWWGLASLLSCARFGYDLLPSSDGGASGSGGGGQGGAAFDSGAFRVAEDSGFRRAPEDSGTGGAGRDASLVPLVDGSAVSIDTGIGSSEAGTGSSEAGAIPVAPALCVFGTPEVLGDPNYPGNEAWSPTLSSDALTMYLGVVIPNVIEQIVVSERSDRDLTFGLGNVLPPPLTSLDRTEKTGTPHLIENGLALYFYSERGARGRDLYVSRRDNTGVEFENLTELSELNSDVGEHLPWVSPNELLIYFVTERDTGNLDIWRATRELANEPFNTPFPATELNSDYQEGRVTFSADRRVVIFASERSGNWDLYRASRAKLGIPFSAPTVLAGFNSAATEMDPVLTQDGQELFFTSDSNGDIAIWRSLRTCQ